MTADYLDATFTGLAVGDWQAYANTNHGREHHTRQLERQ